MYTPGEIVEARRSFSAETATGALRAAMGWINNSGHDATSVRIIDAAGTTRFDKPAAKLKYAQWRKRGEKPHVGCD